MYNIITDMEIDVKPGTYVIAVSGGVDSMALLHMLVQQSSSPAVQKSKSQHVRTTRGPVDHSTIGLVVAHFDHGIRAESAEDRAFVQKLAEFYGLPFEYAEGRLGPKASEEKARTARYAFLETVRQRHGAHAIITAHHQDDLLETAILNMLRGTGRKGLTSLANRPDIIRPLLGVSKKDITEYAIQHQLTWHEDRTNFDEEYLRNYIRHQLLPHFDANSRRKFVEIIDQARVTNEALDTQLLNMQHAQPTPEVLQRAYFNQLPHDIAKEFLASWLRARGIRSFDAATLERVVVSAKTQRPGTIIHLVAGTALVVSKKTLALTGIER